MEIGEVLIGESLIQYDYGALKDGNIRVYRAGEIPMGSTRLQPVSATEK